MVYHSIEKDYSYPVPMAKKKTTAPKTVKATRASRTPKPTNRRATDVVHGTWSSGPVFVLAVTGAAIGLNSFWQFPYLAVHNGGMLFLLAFTAALLFLAVPLLMAEIVIGRRAGKLPAAAVRYLVAQDDMDPLWMWLGWIVPVAGFLVFLYLCVIGSWTWAYALRAAVGAFDGKTLDGTLSMFFSFTSDPEKQLFWHAAFVASTIAAVGRGVNLGLEPVIRVGVPLLLGAIVILAVYGSIAGDGTQAISTLFQFSPELFDYKSILVAASEALFCTGIGVSAVMAYGSYLKPGVSITASSFAISVLVLVVSLLASIFVLSVLLATGQQAMPGPTLLFQALPYALARLAGGSIVGTMVYATIGLAAWLSAIALIDAAVGWLRTRSGLSHFRATLVVALMGWFLGVIAILSFNYWAFSFRLLGVEKRLGIFDMVQMVTSNILIPLSALLAALFVSWGLNTIAVRKEMDMRWPVAFRAWLYLNRSVIPLAMFALIFFIFRLYR